MQMFNEQEFKQYHSLMIPQKNGKLILYYKMYTCEKNQASEKNVNLYEALKKQKGPKEVIKSNTKQEEKKATTKKNIREIIADNRSIQVISFDMAFDPAKLKQIFQMQGKIKQVFIGDQKLKQKNNQLAGSKIKKLFFAIIVYKQQKSLQACFQTEEFQQKINQKYRLSLLTSQNSNSQYVKKLFSSHPQDQQEQDQKQQFLNKMEDGGFTIVANSKGDYNFQENEEVEEQPQKKVKKSLNQRIFYKFQQQNQQFANNTHENANYEEMLPEEIIAMEKTNLLKAFLEKQNEIQLSK